MYYLTNYQSPLGELTLVSEGDALCGLWLSWQKHRGAGLPADVRERDGLPVFRAVKKWLDRYFSGRNPGAPDSLLAPQGSEFRQRVWGLLREIPYGETVSYGEIAGKVAAEMGKPCMSARAVGGAVGHNPISIIIPCHRVIGADGSLTGYGGGIQNKIKLLALEGIDVSRLKHTSAL